MTHITSVSGGSIIAAHLVLNWDRYNGSPNEFDAAASELLAFVRLDVRNRIARRFPLSLPLRWPRRLLGLSNRKLTRTGLLEYHYEKYLYGDTSLFELPERPQLHILATNLSEGCLCSFNRNGLLMVRRQPGHAIRIDRIHAGLATVPMAVTASSAFPGFFPPARADRRGGRRQRRRVRPAGVHRRRRLRQPRRPHVPLPGTAAPGGESAVPRRLRRFSGRRRGVVGGRQVQRGNSASPARADPGRRPAADRTVAVTHQRGTAGRGFPEPVRGSGERAIQAHVESAEPEIREATVRKASCPFSATSAPLPVTTRAALRRPEAVGPRRGSAFPCQPLWSARFMDACDQALAEPTPARSRVPAGHGTSLLPQTRQRAGRRPRQRRG